MELLQKLTLYDLFGYTVPGFLAVWLYEYNGKLWQADNISVGSLCILVVLGYVAGALITEIAELFERGLMKFIPESKKDDYWKELCGIYGISTDMISHALENAKIIAGSQNVSAEQLVRQYYTYMYSEIQTDAQYGRLHNYLSAELLYKNMFLVSLFAIYMGVTNSAGVESVIGAAGALCFAIRRIRFAERSRGYTVCWFVQKYRK